MPDAIMCIMCESQNTSEGWVLVHHFTDDQNEALKV